MAKRKTSEVLHGLFAEVVIDAKDRRLRETPCAASLFSARAEARSRPNGFSMTTRASRAQPERPRLLDHDREHARRNRQVVDRVAPRRRARVAALEGGQVAVVAVDVAELRHQLGERGLVEAAVLGEARAGALAKLLERPARLGDADDRARRGARGGSSTAGRERSSCTRGRPSRRRRRRHPNALASDDQSHSFNLSAWSCVYKKRPARPAPMPPPSKMAGPR